MKIKLRAKVVKVVEGPLGSGEAIIDCRLAGRIELDKLPVDAKTSLGTMQLSVKLLAAANLHFGQELFVTVDTEEWGK